MTLLSHKAIETLGEVASSEIEMEETMEEISEEMMKMFSKIIREAKAELRKNTGLLSKRNRMVFESALRKFKKIHTFGEYTRLEESCDKFVKQRMGEKAYNDLLDFIDKRGAGSKYRNRHVVIHDSPTPVIVK